MGRNFRHGTRWSGGSSQTVRGTGYIPLGFKGKSDKVPTQGTVIEATQRQSLKFRERKGIKPSLATFSWDEPKPEPPPKYRPIETYLRKLEAILPNCVVDEVLQVKDDDPHIIVAMLNKGKPFNACFNRATDGITWMEGPNRPRRRMRNALTRKDCK